MKDIISVRINNNIKKVCQLFHIMPNIKIGDIFKNGFWIEMQILINKNPHIMRIFEENLDEETFKVFKQNVSKVKSII